MSQGWDGEAMYVAQGHSGQYWGCPHCHSTAVQGQGLGAPSKTENTSSSITLLVAGNASLAEPDALKCDPMKKAEEGSRRALESSTQGSTLTCAPSPQAPALSPHGAKVRGRAGSVPPSCRSHTPRGPDSAPPQLSPETAPAPSGGGERRGCGLRSLTTRLRRWL